MQHNQSNTTNPEQGSDNVADHSRNEFFKDLRFSFEGDSFQYLLESMWKEFIVSDSFCESSQAQRINQVYHFYKIKEILNDLGKEVSHA